MGSGGEAENQRSVRGETVYGPYVKVRLYLYWWLGLARLDSASSFFLEM